MKVVINTNGTSLTSNFKLLKYLYINNKECLKVDDGFDLEQSNKYLLEYEGRTLVYDEDLKFYYDADNPYSEISCDGKFYSIPCDDSFRSHPALVSAVEELGESLDDYYFELRVIEIPDDVDYEIREGYFCEYIKEKSREWWYEK